MVIRLVLVDDHPIVRAGLRHVLETQSDLEVVGEADGADEALEVIAGERPDVVILDMHLGVDRPDGLEVLRRLPADGPGVLIVTVFDNDRDIDEALGAGALGYVLKDAPEDELVRAIRAVAAGRRPLDPRVAERVLARAERDPALPSPRELEILAAVAEGDDNAAIARRLHISRATVKSHLASVFSKFGVSTRTGAVAEARRRGHLR